MGAFSTVERVMAMAKKVLVPRLSSVASRLQPDKSLKSVVERPEGAACDGNFSDF